MENTIKKRNKRYITYSKAAKIAGCDVSTMSRKVASGKVKGGSFPAYHKGEDGIYYETDIKIKVIDKSTIED